ncbi:MAG: RsmD family RNA methyltransferase [Planctomycetaceae bacterium]|nr:RsmD family RNA methyltransferase [Planctomycetaceae bacterium]
MRHKKTNNKSRKNRSVGSEPAPKEPVGLRIIGGTLRGSKLQYIGDNRVRPMKDRTREALFNLIGPAVKGSYAVDLFSGTGALAIEAISRGAAEAAVIEIHLPTAALLRQNIASLNLLDKCPIHKTDAFFWVKNIARHPAEGPPKNIPWLVFCSPPYNFYTDRQSEMLEMLDAIFREAPENSIFALEYDKHFDTEILPFPLSSLKIREYFPAILAVFNK